MPSLARIIGHERALSGLRRALRCRRLAHALLFSGPAGVGKGTTALALASAVNCRTLPGDGCGTCDDCRKIAEGQHPDLIVLAPDGAYIKIDQVRRLEQHTAVAPYEATMRVIVIDQAEALHPSAANALLKSVEEPRPDTLFVLTTAAPHRVIPTLVSRCQRVRFSPLTTEQVHQILATADGLEQDPATLRWAAEVSEGSPGRALGLLANETWEAAREIAQRLEEAAAVPRMLDVFESVSEMGRDRVQMGRALELLQVKLRADLLACAGDSHQGAASPITARNPLDGDKLGRRRATIRRIDALQRAQQAVRANANAAMTLETLVLALREEACP